MSRRKNETDLKSLEAALADLSPRADGLNRDRILFLAGQASVTRDGTTSAGYQRWAWPSAFAVMSTVAAALLVMVIAGPKPEVVVREVPRPAESDSSDVSPEDEKASPVLAAEDSDPGSLTREEPTAASVAAVLRLRAALRMRRGDATYLNLRDRVLAFGPDALFLPNPRRARQTGEKKPPPSYHELRAIMLGGQGQS